MKGMTYLVAATLFTVVLLIGGCREFHCPPFPDDQLVLLPKLEQGGTITYSNGETVTTLFVEGYWKSKESSSPQNCDCHVCDLSANLTLRNDNFELRYDVFNTTNNRISLTERYYMRMQLNYNNSSSFFEFTLNRNTGLYECNLNDLTQIGSLTIAETTYNDVLLLTSYNEDCFIHKIYYTQHHGIIRFETVAGKVWDLDTF